MQFYFVIAFFTLFSREMIFLKKLRHSLETFIFTKSHDRAFMAGFLCFNKIKREKNYRSIGTYKELVMEVL